MNSSCEREGQSPLAEKPSARRSVIEFSGQGFNYEAELRQSLESSRHKQSMYNLLRESEDAICEELDCLPTSRMSLYKNGMSFVSDDSMLSNKRRKPGSASSLESAAVSSPLILVTQISSMFSAIDSLGSSVDALLSSADTSIGHSLGRYAETLCSMSEGACSLKSLLRGGG